jgi:hypothetical protein
MLRASKTPSPPPQTASSLPLRSPPPISPPPLKRAKTRHLPTNEQRLALRTWWNDDSLGVRKHKDAIAWWKAQYGWDLSTSTCSDILSQRYAHLDEGELTKHQLSAKRTRKPQWETLEAALLEWQIRYDKHPNSGPTTGDLLRFKAAEFWQKLPEYNGKPIPIWSNGWLTRFKKRSGLKELRRHGEAGSAQIDDNTEKIMQEIRDEGKNYNADDIYNFDETGYYWKMKPDRSLTTFTTSGKKKEKARITVGLTCNATGTDKLPLWFIGTAARPNCFRSANLFGLEAIGAFWRYNKTAWMNHHIMKEYLLWLDMQMRVKGKRALLLMDNFSAHEVAVEQLMEAQQLTNTKIMWLPPNATSHHQPLDQGIIENWKTNTRKQFVMFMARTFDQGKDLSREMDVLRAIRWGISAWENDVLPRTIQNCWARSQAVDFGQFPLPNMDIWSDSQDSIDEIRQGIYRMRERGFLVDITSNVRDYISPYIEKVFDQAPDNLVDDIVAHYIQQDVVDSDEEEAIVVPPPPITYEEALKALHTLRRYEEENKYGDLELLRKLRQHERSIGERFFTSKQQVKLDRWFLSEKGGEF